MYTRPDFKNVWCAVLLPVLLAGLMCLGGCKPDKETAARIEALETEMASVQSQLDETNSQTEALTLKLETLSQTLAETQEDIRKLARLSEENGVMDSQLGAVKTHLVEVTSQRDAALAEAKETRAMLEQLQSQLTKQIQKTAALAEQIADLQQTLAAPVEEAAAAVEESEPKPDAPIVGFPEAPGFKD
ncbi:MAG: hypothetical protein ACYS72_04210 [Planctomycetota bacterium]|jgi:chromosome segregation ATPase